MKKNESRKVEVAYLVGTCFGLGYLPKMPGTWGTLGGVVFAAAVYSLTESNTAFRLALLGGLVAVLIAACFSLPVIQNHSDQSDPQQFVLDEVAGFLTTVLITGKSYPLWFLAVAGFFAFRIFDILKPPGASWLDKRYPSFVGVMGDDVVSGLYAFCLLWVIWRLGNYAGLLH